MGACALWFLKTHIFVFTLSNYVVPVRREIELNIERLIYTTNAAAAAQCSLVLKEQLGLKELNSPSVFF